MTRDEMAVAAHEEAEMLTHLRGPGDTTLLSTHTVDRVILFLRAVDAALRDRPAPTDDLVALVQRLQGAERAHEVRRTPATERYYLDALAAVQDWRPAAPAPVAPPDDLKDVAMAARRGLAFGHQATPQTPERMIERKEQALGQILDICERHGVSSSVLRAPAPVAAPAPETPAHTCLDLPAGCDACDAETPAPDAMPALGPDDVLSETSRFDGERCVSYTVSIERNGVVIWRRQEAQP